MSVLSFSLEGYHKCLKYIYAFKLCYLITILLISMFYLFKYQQNHCYYLDLINKAQYRVKIGTPDSE